MLHTFFERRHHQLSNRFVEYLPYGSSQNGRPLVPASTLSQTRVADSQQSKGPTVAGNGDGTTHACSCICGCENASPAQVDDLECLVRQSLPIRSKILYRATAQTPLSIGTRTKVVAAGEMNGPACQAYLLCILTLFKYPFTPSSLFLCSSSSTLRLFASTASPFAIRGLRPVATTLISNTTFQVTHFTTFSTSIRQNL